MNGTRDAAPLPALVLRVRELREGLEELLFVARTTQGRLARIDRDLRRLRPHLRDQTVASILGRVEREKRDHEALAARVLELCRAAERASLLRPEQIAALEGAADELGDILRSTEAVVAGLAIAIDWQSPSFLHSIRPCAGRDLGRVIANHTDYRRDRHPDADSYETAYVGAMIDRGRGVRALLTSCGMAAFTTVLDWLRAEGSLDGAVLAGRDLYHESRDLVRAAVGGRLVVVDELDTAAMLAAIRTARPTAVFLDSLGNTARVAMPDVEAVARELGAIGCDDTYLVIDNTALGPTFQPFSITPRDRGPHLVVFESLLKYAQLGRDRANAGVILAAAEDAEPLERWREHLGTNIGDFAVHILPPPCPQLRQLLERRLARMERNALMIASRVETELSRLGLGDAVSVAHPRLSGHQSAVVTARRRFGGSCVSLSLSEPGVVGPELIRGMILEARRRGAQLVAGSSFGFDVTRIYLTVDHSGIEPAFVRIAAGTEHQEESELVADSIATAVATAGARARPGRARVRRVAA